MLESKGRSLYARLSTAGAWVEPALAAPVHRRRGPEELRSGRSRSRECCSLRVHHQRSVQPSGLRVQSRRNAPPSPLRVGMLAEEIQSAAAVREARREEY